MDEPRLFESGNNLHSPAGGRAHPFQKRLRVARVAQRAGGHHPHRVGPQPLCRSMETAQYLHRLGHRFGCQKIGSEYSFTQASDFAVVVDAVESAPTQARNFQTNRVGTNVNRSEDGHGGCCVPNILKQRRSLNRSPASCRVSRGHYALVSNELWGYGVGKGRPPAALSKTGKRDKIIADTNAMTIRCVVQVSFLSPKYAAGMRRVVISATKPEENATAIRKFIGTQFGIQVQNSWPAK